VAWAQANSPLKNSGWRLPTLAEAQALYSNRANVSSYSALSRYGDYIVTSTPYGAGTYGLRFSDGSLFVAYPTNVGYITLVRSAISNLVIDRGLMWFRDRSSLRNTADSTKFCSVALADIGLGGGGWRLPTQSEAQGFVDDKAAISLYQTWINSYGDCLVTQTPVPSGTWGINMSTGAPFTAYSGNVGYNACVRSAQ
jgi:hypothetical protein